MKLVLTVWVSTSLSKFGYSQAVAAVFTVAGTNQLLEFEVRV